MGWSEAIGEGFKFLNSFLSSPKKQIQKVVSIYDSMHNVLDETPVERFLIFRAHNGGGIIKPNNTLYVSVIYEDYTNPFRSVKDLYQKVALDEGAIRFLLDLSHQKVLQIKTKELREGLIKSIYEGEGVMYAEAHYLGHDNKNIYYCTCGTSVESGWEDNSYQKMTIQMQINNIKNNIK